MIFSEIKFDQMTERLRFDAEHYRAVFLKNEAILKQIKCKHLIETWGRIGVHSYFSRKQQAVKPSPSYSLVSSLLITLICLFEQERSSRV